MKKICTCNSSKVKFDKRTESNAIYTVCTQDELHTCWSGLIETMMRRKGMYKRRRSEMMTADYDASNDKADDERR
jgi:hypothetical protein